MGCLTLLAGFTTMAPLPARGQAPAEVLMSPLPEGRRSQPELFGKVSRESGAAPSRIGKLPTYDIPAAAGASESGFDSLNRKRRKPKFYPGTKPLKRGTAAQPAASPSASSLTAAQRAPVAAAVAGTAPGQPARRRLRPDDDPFGQVGFYAGSFLTKTAVELSGGYDSNPARINNGSGSAFYMIAPELMMTSEWTRHALALDLRGSFTWFGSKIDCACLPGASSVPDSLDRPDLTGKLTGRIDVTRDLRIDSEARLRVATENPGSPSIDANLTRYVNYATLGGTVGAVRRFNRLELGVSGAVDRTAYEWSRFTDGSSASNHDRDLVQYGATARAAYEMTPGVKPFVEAAVDRRVHDIATDRSGYLRDSRGMTVKAGSTFELTRLVTGEASVGYLARRYDDARLGELSGLLTSASLVWTVTPLTTVKLTATSTIDETTVAGVPGVVNRSYAAQVDHSFRRWLVGTLKFSVGDARYEGSTRRDQSYSASAGLVYKLSRTVHLKGEFRRDWLHSSIAGSDYTASIVTLGLRFQR